MPPDNEADYEVGYGKPPRHTRFKTGQSGNLRGRPNGSHNLSTLLSEALNEPVVVAENGGRRSMHFGCTCYHPLFVFNQLGDLERCALRPGNVHSADGWRVVLEPVVARYRDTVKRLYFRGDAAFASPEIYEFLEAEGMGYAIRLPANSILQSKIGYLPKRPVGRPAHDLRRYFASFIYQAQSWRKPRRVVAKVEWHPSCTRASALSSPTWRVRPARCRLLQPARHSGAMDQGGQGCDQVDAAVVPEPSPPTRCASSSTYWPTISVTSCGRWRCPKRLSRGR